MNNKTEIEKILKLHGLSAGAHDEEIRSVLLSAQYKKDEVDTAIMVLRENTKTKKTRVDGLHKVFRSDMTLSPTEISALLGVDVHLPDKIEVRKKAAESERRLHALLMLLSFALAALALVAYMYVTEMGLFHPSSAIAFTFLE